MSITQIKKKILNKFKIAAETKRDHEGKWYKFKNNNNKNMFNLRGASNIELIPYCTHGAVEVSTILRSTHDRWCYWLKTWLQMWPISVGMAIRTSWGSWRAVWQHCHCCMNTLTALPVTRKGHTQCRWCWRGWGVLLLTFLKSIFVLTCVWVSTIFTIWLWHFVRD